MLWGDGFFDNDTQEMKPKTVDGQVATTTNQSGDAVANQDDNQPAGNSSTLNLWNGKTRRLTETEGTGRQQEEFSEGGPYWTGRHQSETAILHSCTSQPAHKIARTAVVQESTSTQPARVIATTAAGQDFAATQPALVVATTTAGQEVAFAQHDGNQVTKKSRAREMKLKRRQRRRSAGQTDAK